MLHDRVLVSTEAEAGERRSSGGILIPATVAIGRRLAWGEVVAVGHRACARSRWATGCCSTLRTGPRSRSADKDYVLLRERDLHAVAAERLEDGQTGLYL